MHFKSCGARFTTFSPEYPLLMVPAYPWQGRIVSNYSANRAKQKSTYEERKQQFPSERGHQPEGGCLDKGGQLFVDMGIGQGEVDNSRTGIALDWIDDWNRERIGDPCEQHGGNAGRPEFDGQKKCHRHLDREGNEKSRKTAYGYSACNEFRGAGMAQQLQIGIFNGSGPKRFHSSGSFSKTNIRLFMYHKDRAVYAQIARLFVWWST